MTTLPIVKNILTIIQIVGPIILIISLTLQITKLMANPNNKDSTKKIKNSIAAILFLFFIPLLIHLTMTFLGDSFTLSTCWNKVGTNNTGGYQSKKDLERKIIVGGNDAYQDPIKETPGPSAVPLPGSEEEENGNEASSDNSDLPSLPEGTISGDLEVHFINPNSRVDAIYIKVGDKSMFIDGGFKGDSKKEIAYMDKIGVKSIDYYVGTHSHKDHVEAAPPIIKKYGIKKVIVGRETCNGSGGTACSWYTIQYFAKEQKISLDGVSASILKPGDTFYLGSAKISCIGPISVNNSLGRGDVGQNYNSLIFRLDYGSKSFLFTGDGSSSKGFKAIEQNYPGKLRVNVLNNAHHNGDSGSSSYSLIKAEYVVFTTKDGSLPSQSCINNIKNNGCKQYFIVTNSKDGNVVFSSDGTNLNIRKNHNP